MMSDDDSRPEPGPDSVQTQPASHHGDDMAAAIELAQRLEQRSARGHHGNLWVQVSRVGTLGWLLALPIVGGALLGHYIDRRLGTGLSFTLATLALGLTIAGYALWRQANDLEHS